MSYVKLFGSILDSTLWREDNETRILWLTMLAMADRDGVVEASLPGLADRARLTRDQVVAGLGKLQAPDPDSRSPVAEGRRIEKVDGGWALINFEYYRDKQSADDLRAKAAARQRRKREREKSAGTDAINPADFCASCLADAADGGGTCPKCPAQMRAAQ